MLVIIIYDDELYWKYFEFLWVKRCCGFGIVFIICLIYNICDFEQKIWIFLILIIEIKNFLVFIPAMMIKFI